MRSSTFAKFSTGYIYSLWETKKPCSNIWIWEWNMSDCRMAQSAMLVFSEWVICRAVNGASRNFTVPGKGPYSWKCEPTSNFTIKNLLRQQRSKAARQWISLQTSMFKRRNFTNSHWRLLWVRDLFIWADSCSFCVWHIQQFFKVDHQNVFKMITSPLDIFTFVASFQNHIYCYWSD